MSPKARFLVWILGVAGALAAPAWLLAGGPAAFGLAGTQSLAALTLFFWLLATTPPEAIRIGRGPSVLIVSAGLVWLVAAGSLGAFTLAAPVALIALLLTLVLLLPASSGVSVWWGALVLWHPGLWLGARETLSLEAGPLALRLGWLAAIAAVVLSVEERPPGRDARAWALWAGCVLLTLYALWTIGDAGVR